MDFVTVITRAQLLVSTGLFIGLVVMIKLVGSRRPLVDQRLAMLGMNTWYG